MTNRLQTLVPAMFQPTDPVIVAGEPSKDGSRAEKLTAFTAIASALLLVALIAVLMGMT
jgi:hypothetical protein